MQKDAEDAGNKTACPSDGLLCEKLSSDEGPQFCEDLIAKVILSAADQGSYFVYEKRRERFDSKSAANVLMCDDI